MGQISNEQETGAEPRDAIWATKRIIEDGRRQ